MELMHKYAEMLPLRSDIRIIKKEQFANSKKRIVGSKFSMPCRKQT